MSFYRYTNIKILLRIWSHIRPKSPYLWNQRFCRLYRKFIESNTTKRRYLLLLNEKLFLAEFPVGVTLTTSSHLSRTEYCFSDIDSSQLFCLLFYYCALKGYSFLIFTSGIVLYWEIEWTGSVTACWTTNRQGHRFDLGKWGM